MSKATDAAKPSSENAVPDDQPYTRPLPMSPQLTRRDNQPEKHPCARQSNLAIMQPPRHGFSSCLSPASHPDRRDTPLDRPQKNGTETTRWKRNLKLAHSP